MAVTIDGPRIAPKSGQAKQLVVFLHGYGADGNDLIEIGKQWQSLLPDAAFVSPHAPEPCGMSPMGRQWFGLTFRDPDERWRGVTTARPTLDTFLDAELAVIHGIPRDEVLGVVRIVTEASHIILRLGDVLVEILIHLHHIEHRTIHDEQ